MNSTKPVHYDAIVIGAGIAGAAIAERMTARGMGRIAVLEKEKTYCTGSSSRSAGGFRQQFDEDISDAVLQQQIQNMININKI